MKKALLLVFCLMLALFLLPGGMASWGGDLFIGGTVTTGEFLEDEKPASSSEEAQPEEISDEDTAEETGDDPLDEEPDEEGGQDAKPKPPVKEYVLEITGRGLGGTTPEQGSHVYEQGREVKITATPEEGWIFDKWLVGETQYSGATITIVINNDTSAEAVFVKLVDESENGKEFEKNNDYNGGSKNENNGSEEPSNKEETQANSENVNGAEQ